MGEKKNQEVGVLGNSKYVRNSLPRQDGLYADASDLRQAAGLCQQTLGTSTRSCDDCKTSMCCVKGIEEMEDGD